MLVTKPWKLTNALRHFRLFHLQLYPLSSHQIPALSASNRVHDTFAAIFGSCEALDMVSAQLEVLDDRLASKELAGFEEANEIYSIDSSEHNSADFNPSHTPQSCPMDVDSDSPIASELLRRDEAMIRLRTDSENSRNAALKSFEDVLKSVSAQNASSPYVKPARPAHPENTSSSASSSTITQVVDDNDASGPSSSTPNRPFQDRNRSNPDSLLETSLLLSITKDIAPDALRDFTFRRTADPISLEALMPSRVSHFFKAILSHRDRSNSSIDSYINSKKSDLKTNGEIGNLVGLPAANVTLTDAIGVEAWPTQFLAHKIDTIHKKNLFSPDKLLKMSKGEESPAKLQSAVCKITSMLGQIIRVFCILCLEMSPSDTMPKVQSWALAQDVARRKLDSNLNLSEDAINERSKATENLLSKFGYSRDQVCEVKIPSLELLSSHEEEQRLSKLLYTSNEALDAICSPIFTTIFARTVDILCVSPKTKVNVLKNFRILLDWASQRNALLSSSSLTHSQPSHSSPYSSFNDKLGAEIELSRSIIALQLSSHSAAVAMIKANQLSHKDLVGLGKRISLEDLPSFFGSALDKLEELSSKIFRTVKRVKKESNIRAKQPPSTNPCKMKLFELSQEALATHCEEYQTLLMMCTLALSAGQRLQVLNMMSLSTLSFDTEHGCFWFYPDIMEKKARVSKCVMPSQLNRFIRLWIGRNPPLNPLLKASDDSEDNEDLPDGGIRQIWHMLGIGHDRSNSLHPDGLPLNNFLQTADSWKTLLDLGGEHFGRLGTLFLNHLGVALSSAAASRIMFRGPPLVHKDYKYHRIGALAWRHTVTTLATTNGIIGSEKSLTDYLGKLSLLMNNSVRTLLAHYDDNDRARQAVQTLEPLVMNMLPERFVTSLSVKNISEVVGVRYSEHSGIAISAKYGGNDAVVDTSVLSMNKVVGEAMAQFLNCDEFMKHLECALAKSRMIRKEGVVFASYERESASGAGFYESLASHVLVARENSWQREDYGRIAETIESMLKTPPTPESAQQCLVSVSRGAEDTFKFLRNREITPKTVTKQMLSKGWFPKHMKRADYENYFEEGSEVAKVLALPARIALEKKSKVFIIEKMRALFSPQKAQRCAELHLTLQNFCKHKLETIIRSSTPSEDSTIRLPNSTPPFQLYYSTSSNSFQSLFAFFISQKG